ncbi:MAG: PASTA domain-containing protein [Holophagales bacterium]|nr:PASTA domain-containing protein [Holophagales bacterium]MYG31589.1 PASTA domain-containing protein [Holophagales bacterium]MYI78341.1 PASTA domain-containing protein [Holophagales bacterium]
MMAGKLPDWIGKAVRHPWLRRGVLFAAYGGLLVALLGASSYLALSNFVRSGVIAVPDVVGLEQSQAEAGLATAGLALQRVEDDRYDEAVPAGHVLRQDPPAGSAVKEGSGVVVYLSRGRELVETPDLSGQVLQTAQVSLTASGLQMGRSRSVFAESGEPGTVVRQDPPAGSPIDPSSQVDLMVSLANPGAMYVMPDLIDLPEEPVRDFFETRGFRLGRVKYEPYEGVPAGIILRQYPLPGHPLRQSDSIALVVAAQDSR